MKNITLNKNYLLIHYKNLSSAKLCKNTIVIKKNEKNKIS